ncbi:ABC transporter permease subunit [Roseibium sp. RKSG952]|nr:ABC transporter permease subunit [Roseibium sp. RKSG952]
MEPLEQLRETPISLDPAHLPEYALRTTFRMLVAMVFSLIFTFIFAPIAAKNRRAEKVLIPALDILQSVPILGFISVTIVFFMSLAPGRTLGAEFAAIFAIFTSQAWNMAFSFYQSLRTVPTDLGEVATSLRFPAFMRFWRLEVPLAMPGLVWNMMMSMSGGWFFVVASEAISVGDTTIALPGIGSYIAAAIAARDVVAIGWSVGAMLIVILLYDQLLFRPLVAWSYRFRIDQENYEAPPRSVIYEVLRRSRVGRGIGSVFQALLGGLIRLLARRNKPPRKPRSLGAAGTVAAGPFAKRQIWGDRIWFIFVLGVSAWMTYRISVYVMETLTLWNVLEAFGLGLITGARVLILVLIASAVWVPVGVYVGLRPGLSRIVQPVAQILAAYPANLLFPFLVSLIVLYRLNPDIWLTPLIILGTQWYILFNVIAGAQTLPRDQQDVARSFGVTGWLWWRRVALPAVFPYYVTGAITAAGGSWNASIVAEYASWGHETVTAHGIGAYITEATNKGDYHEIVLGIAVMSILVIATNRLLWRPLYDFAERRYRID